MIDTNLILFFLFVVADSVGIVVIIFYSIDIVYRLRMEESHKIAWYTGYCIIVSIVTVWLTLYWMIIEFLIWKYSGSINILGMV